VKPVYRIATIVASIVIGVAGIAAALAYVNRTEKPSAATPATTVISLETLARNDGQNGNKCYVAVDGTVYQIEGYALWASGSHEPSGGRAKCGQDLSAVIDQAPHGRSKLNLLTVVGKLEQR
jgi:predicted heme/steroid binding protein